MKTSLIFMALLLPAALLAQKPLQVKSIAAEPKSNEWYVEQAGAWKKEVDKNPKNANAWLNYYRASRYADFGGSPFDWAADKQALMNRIVAGMEKNVPNTFEYYTCRIGQLGIRDTEENFRLSSAAYKLNPRDAGIVENLINYHEVKNNKAELSRYYKELGTLGRFDFTLQEYNFNLLMSVEKNAVLITGGDNDTYPSRYLQVVKNVRPDITLINIYLAAASAEYLNSRLKEKNIGMKPAPAADLKRESIDSYLKQLITGIRKSNPSVPLYMATTAGCEELFADSLYCTGLAYAYSETKMDNLSLLKANVEERFHLDYLRPDFFLEVSSSRLADQLKSNYITPFGMLYRYCRNTGKPSERLAFYKEFFITQAMKMYPEESKEKLVQQLENGR
jgi:hypothetical protein